MTQQKANFVIKLVAPFLVLLIIGIAIIFVIKGRAKSSSKNVSQKQFIIDSATGDTSVETIKTLTAELSNVREQNKKIIADNENLKKANDKKFAKFRDDTLTSLNNALNKFEQGSAESASQNVHQAIEGNNGNYPVNNSDTGGPAHDFVWVNDMQGTAEPENVSDNNAGNAKNTENKTGIPSLLNPGKVVNSSINNNSQSQNANQELIPYFTIPVNATLTGAVLMQPLIGRIPIDGKVQNPYTFKVIIGAKNIAANGVYIPANIQGIVASGTATGDMLGSCVRGDITAITFVFQDGRISTTKADDNSSLGTIAAANGNPCIAGTFHTNAPVYLGGTVALAAAQGYGNALSQAETSTSFSDGVPISAVIKNANRYAAGQAAASSATAAQQWWDERVKNSFDFVYVPNISSTGALMKLNIDITKVINIDYDPNGRKVSYEHEKNNYAATHLD